MNFTFGLLTLGVDCQSNEQTRKTKNNVNTVQKGFFAKFTWLVTGIYLLVVVVTSHRRSATGLQSDAVHQKIARRTVQTGEET